MSRGVVADQVGRALLAAQGRVGEARAAFRGGDELLRQVGDQLGLGKLLCGRARVELADGKQDAAQLALSEAEAIGAGPLSELGAEIIGLCSAFGVQDPSTSA